MVKSDVVRDVDHFSSAPYSTTLVSERLDLQSSRCDPMMRRRIDL
jgi:hypothetical protein